MKYWKSSNGSITLLVVVTVLFFVIITVGVYVANSNTRVSQMQEIDRIKEVYEADVENVESIYEEITGSTSKEYVKNGLIVHYDAINNTGNGHDNNATIWKDLSGHNNDLTLSNFNDNETSGWGEYALNFDGINDFGTISNIAQELIDNVTISTRIYSKASGNYKGIYGNHMGTSYGVSGILAQYQDGLMRIGYNGNIVDLAADMVTNKDITLTVQMGTSIGTKVYINGTLVGELKKDTDLIQPGTEFWIGKSFNTTDRYFLGTMNNFMIYNRLLTEEEIKVNYEADLQQY